MRKPFTKMLCIIASIFTLPALAANLESPLYQPGKNKIYSKTAGGFIYKINDSTEAQVKAERAGETEVPVWRIYEDLGYGITNDWSIFGSFGYTYDDDANRHGMHRGRLGTNYRIFDTEYPFIWDVYSEFHLGGISDMKGAYTSKGFVYDNYSNGRWGVTGGTRFGKTWSNFTLSAYIETLQTFGSHNNKINISSLYLDDLIEGLPHTLLTSLGFPDEISVNLKSTHEITTGLNAFFEFEEGWSLSNGFRYVHHADNGVKNLHTDITPTGQDIANGMVKELSHMHDGWDEYTLILSLSKQITEKLQLAVYYESTYDTGHKNSQNSTDTKTELGVRANMEF